MVDFDTVLARADGPSLSAMMPAGAAKVVTTIDPRLSYPKDLRGILLAIRSPASILEQHSSRQVLLDLLRPAEAERLAYALGVGLGPKLYDELKRLPFNTASQRRKLLQFFGVGAEEKPAAAESSEVVTISPQYPLFSHQITALEEVGALLRSPPHRVLLHMPTGAGKTRTAMNAVAEYLRGGERRVAVWLAHSEELCFQAASEFERAWGVLGNRPLQIARYWGQHRPDLRHFRDGFVVAGFPKAYAALRAGYEDLGYLSAKNPLVVVDEAHQVVAPTYRQVVDLLMRPLSTASLLGLSATPGRTWNEPEVDEALSAFFARRKVSLSVPGFDNPVSYLIEKGYLARPRFRRIETSGAVELSAKELADIKATFDVPQSALDRLALNEKRNLIVVRETEELLRRHRRVILFAASVDQSELLAAVLSARGFWAKSVSSRSTMGARANAIEDFKNEDEAPKVLCNYGVLTTGFDAPRTSAAVVARPTLSLVLYSQMIGRALRGVKAGGNDEAEILTVVDTDLPGFSSVESAFANWEDVWRTQSE